MARVSNVVLLNEHPVEQALLRYFLSSEGVASSSLSPRAGLDTLAAMVSGTELKPGRLAIGYAQANTQMRGPGAGLGFLALLRPPFGTALGIYTLWVLLPQQSAQEYEQLSSSSVQAGLQHSR